ncbi:hypothetical protein D927_01055 [Enterococcus faecalis 02-MB-BW-10]|nr:hypothetical protein D927_01055 [Enterococcus faecalis 02-MB-BW-10]
MFKPPFSHLILTYILLHVNINIMKKKGGSFLMKKLALGSLLLVALGVIGASFALTTEVKQEAGYGHPLIDHKI